MRGPVIQENMVILLPRARDRVSVSFGSPVQVANDCGGCVRCMYVVVGPLFGDLFTVTEARACSLVCCYLLLSRQPEWVEVSRECFHKLGDGGVEDLVVGAAERKAHLELLFVMLPMLALRIGREVASRAG